MGIGSKFGILSETGNNIVTDGLVFNMDAAAYKSYPRTGTNVFNLASGSLPNSGSLINGLTWTGISPSSSFNFDGDDDYIELGQIDSSNPISFVGTTENTWEVWINSTGTGDTYQRIIDKSSAGGGVGGWFFSLGSNPSLQRIYCKINNQTGIDDVTISGYTHNVWQHLVVTRVNDTTNGWKTYLNGVLKDERNSGNNPIPTNTEGCRIGSWNHSTAREFNGQIAVVRLYNHALSAAEVLQNFNAGKDRFGL